ncbi:hypothetical protein, partial [Legionella tunisiensis]|uniref:hypothetical protein n=1 Tax=Legionella tunisiensis TaxID=1034944 RepID=UPI0005948FE7
MRKLLPTALLILFVTHAVAEPQAVLSREDIDRINKELLAKAGLSVPDSTEIRLVSANQLLFKNNSRINQSNDDTEKEIRDYLAMNREQQKNGFVKSSEPRAKELLEMEKTSLYHK